MDAFFSLSRTHSDTHTHARVGGLLLKYGAYIFLSVNTKMYGVICKGVHLKNVDRKKHDHYIGIASSCTFGKELRHPIQNVWRL